MNRIENEEFPKKNKHTARKVIAAVMAMTIVSAGSIAGYRQIEGRLTSRASASASTESTKTAEDTSDDEEEAAEDAFEKIADKINADTVSIVKAENSKSEELTTEEAVEKVLPSVVGVESKFEVTSSNDSYYYGFGFGGFGNMTPQTTEATATGTGVIITDNGYIVTNAHVIYDSEYGGGLAKDISILLSDEKSYDAEVIGYDTDCDIAVLKIDAEGLTAAEFGDSDSLKLGQSVIAIGNPLGFELTDTVTSGIVSGLNRNITINDKEMNLIQTDAAINSGNSGGPLINKYGQVIGINSSKMSSSYSETTIEGIGFAIPSNEVSAIVDDLMKYGYVTGKPQLGISCQDVTETIHDMYNIPVGVYVTAVTDKSAADKAGIESGDVIIKIDDVEVSTTEELNAEKNKHEAGEIVKLTIVRNGEEKDITVTLDEVQNAEKQDKQSEKDDKDED